MSNNIYDLQKGIETVTDYSAMKSLCALLQMMIESDQDHIQFSNDMAAEMQKFREFVSSNEFTQETANELLDMLEERFLSIGKTIAEFGPVYTGLLALFDQRLNAVRN